MARLRDFRSDTTAINDGSWVRVDEALFGDLDILSRGYTDAFIDAQAARERKAAEPYAGDTTRLPNAVRRSINATLLRDFLVLGVRNLLDDNDEPVAVEAFLDMLDDPACHRLTRACWLAAGRVNAMTAAQVDTALGNSSRPSASISTGVASESD